MSLIDEQVLREVQKHEQTLDQVVRFQGDQAKVNQAVKQKIAVLETRLERIEHNQKRIINLLEGKTEVP